MDGKVHLIVILITELFFLSACDPRQYIVVEEGLNWIEAQNYCRTKYHDLATIESLEENNQVMKVLEGLNIAHVWIGIHRYPTEWKWSLETESEDGTDFRSWAIGRPSDASKGLENCVEIFDGDWFDTHCTTTLGFFCSTGSSESPSYEYVNTAMTWFSALDYCRKNHVDLAVIRNFNHNNELKNMVTDKHSWIGLYREPWKWSDGKPLSFSHWTTGEPNQGVLAECVHLLQGFWADTSCGYPLPFVCNAGVWKNVVKVKVTPTPFTQDLDESAEDILLQWNERLKNLYPEQDIKIRWKKQRDGKIFHPEKKEKENPDSCVMDT